MKNIYIEEICSLHSPTFLKVPKCSQQFAIYDASFFISNLRPLVGLKCASESQT